MICLAVWLISEFVHAFLPMLHRTWHAALPNTSNVERRCVILSYTPFWHKPFGQVIDNGKRLMASGKLTTPLLKQLFHVEAGGGYGGTPENAAQHPRMDHV